MQPSGHRDGKLLEQESHLGLPASAVRELGISDKHGTTQHFWPDPTIFQSIVYNRDILEGRLRELSFLNKRISITMNDLREKDEEGNTYSKVFYSEGGIIEFVEMLDKIGKRNALIAKPLYVEAFDA